MHPGTHASRPPQAGEPPGPTGPRNVRPWLALLVLAAGYAALRLAMNREFEGAPWDDLLDFTAAKPFGLRVLVPLLAWPLHTLLRIPTTWVFGLFETLATIALVLATAAALRPHVPPRWATALGVLLVLLLPIAFLLQHRWPIFYPYDTPAMAFTAGGLALLLHGRWRLAAALSFLAALNRESAILLPFAALALHLRVPPVPSDIPHNTQPVPSDIPHTGTTPVPLDIPHVNNLPVPSDIPHTETSSSHSPRADAPPGLPLRLLLPRAFALLAAVLLARGLVALVLRDNPGAPMQFLVDGSPRLLQNLAWLEEPAHWLRLPAYFGFLPLAWAVLHPWMPTHLRRLGWLALAYVVALMWVANIDEPRVYGEAIVLLYLPVAVALVRWLRSDPIPT